MSFVFVEVFHGTPETCFIFNMIPGGNAAMFSVINSSFLFSLPFHRLFSPIFQLSVHFLFKGFEVNCKAGTSIKGINENFLVLFYTVL